MKYIRLFAKIALIFIIILTIYSLYMFISSHQNYYGIGAVILAVLAFIIKKSLGDNLVANKMIQAITVIYTTNNSSKITLTEFRIKALLFIFELRMSFMNENFKSSSWIVDNRLNNFELENEVFDIVKKIIPKLSVLTHKNLNPTMLIPPKNLEKDELNLLKDILNEFDQFNNDKLKKYIYKIINELKFDKTGLISFKESINENKERLEKVLNDYK